ncbi:calmodulin [Ditylenchus destructor]|uniref:Calmodulin n=1 Tax=Ditylenchus destructor TaxID=166010 RepID=A0AAD4NGI8_9BILA|nr:calmodulin [Ditylenchus destructor]
MSENLENLVNESYDVLDAFKVLDKAGFGNIPIAALRDALTNMGEKLTDEEVDWMLSQVDVSNGQFNYMDFLDDMAAFMN